MSSPPTKIDSRHLTFQEKKLIFEDFLAGFQIKTIAEKRALSYWMVSRIIRNFKNPPSSSSLDVRIYSRLSRHDHKKLQELAAKRSESLSSLFRRVLRRAAGFFDADKELAEAVLKLSLEMKKIGINLNQVVYHINREALLQGKTLPSNNHLESIEEMRSRIMKLADKIEKLFARAACRRATTVEALINDIV